MKGYNFFEAIKALFPRSQAFRLFHGTSLYKLVKALSVLPEDIRTQAEKVYFDLFPDTTRHIEKWATIFSLFFKEAEYEKRPDIIKALWRSMAGGQSAVFLEDLLHCIDSDIKVIENIPPSDPTRLNIVTLSVNGHRSMCSGNRKAVCTYRIGNANFTPSLIKNDVSSIYDIPGDKSFWEFCFFICKSVIREPGGHILYVEPLVINGIWKNIFEYLVLRVKPVHSTAVIYIKWIDNSRMLSVNGYRGMRCGNR